jgi:hypothetical protein
LKELIDAGLYQGKKTAQLILINSSGGLTKELAQFF